MPKSYTIEAEVTGIAAGRINDVIDAMACTADWEIPPEGWWTEEHAVAIESEAMLRAGEGSKGFAERFARSTWAANAGYCPISLTIDRPGRSVFEFNQLDHRRLTDDDQIEPRRTEASRQPSRGGAWVPKPVPLKHYGGKAMLAPWIAGLLPQGGSYAELFAGGAAVFFNRPPSGSEWLNDLDPEVMRFYEQLQGSFATVSSVAREICSELADLWAPRDLARAPFIRMARRLNGDLSEEVSDDTLFPRSPAADRRYGPAP